MFPLSIREDSFLNSQHGKTACPRVGNSVSTWSNLLECIYPEWSAQSCLQICPLCISSLHTALILSSLECQAALSYCLLCSLPNHSSLNHPSALYLWNTLHFHAAIAISSVSHSTWLKWVVGAGKEFSCYLQQAISPAQVSPKDSLLP